MHVTRSQTNVDEGLDRHNEDDSAVLYYKRCTVYQQTAVWTCRLVVHAMSRTYLRGRLHRLGSHVSSSGRAAWGSCFRIFR